MSEADDTGAAPEEIEPLESVARYVASFGAGARPLREVVASLAGHAQSVDLLVARYALSRRTVERLLDAFGSDLEHGPDGFRIRWDRVAAYRERFEFGQLTSTALVDPLAERLRDPSGLVTEMERLIAAAPEPLPALDHVTATAETAVRRALWLDSSFDLAGGRLLFVGDHDLTSLAMSAVNPGVAVSVVDLDERLLEYVDGHASSRGMDIRCYFADLRFGLPPATRGWADAAFTDPPYTPEGVRLFGARGLQGLRDRDNGRLIVAYGFGERHPTLGLRVQRAMQGLHLAFEAIYPGFNRYHGAQAVGGASDLYVCRPTSRTWQALDRLVADAEANIYTRGPRAVEGGRTAIPAEAATAVEAVATGPRRDARVSVVVGTGWPTRPAAAHRVELQRVLADGLPAPAARRRPLVAVADLSADPGFWLLRLLLAANADRLAVLVPNNHPDLADGAGQRRVTHLVRHKYRLRFRRSTPTSDHAVVEADRVDPATLKVEARLARWLVDRAHGRVANVWREGLVQTGRERGGPLTKKEARAIVRASVRNEHILDARLVDLPRHQIANLLTDVLGSGARGH